MRKKFKAKVPNELLAKLWEEICDIETVTVSIPVNYTPELMGIFDVPKVESGRVYNVSAVPFRHIEKIFQDYMLKS